MMNFTYLTRLSSPDTKLPPKVIMTDDPMRVKMLAAHWLDNAALLYELRGMTGYTGKYKDEEIAVLATGFGGSSARLYMHDAALLGMRSVIYLGECIAQVQGIRLRDVIIAAGGDRLMTERALDIASQFSLPVSVREVNSCERFYSDDRQIAADIIDFASESVAEFAEGHGIAAISVLTVSQNTATGERMEEHERQSRFHDAARLAFEVMASCGT